MWETRRATYALVDPNCPTASVKCIKVQGDRNKRLQGTCSYINKSITKYFNSSWVFIDIDQKARSIAWAKSIRRGQERDRVWLQFKVDWNLCLYMQQNENGISTRVL